MKKTAPFPEMVVVNTYGKQIAAYYDPDMTIQMDDPFPITDFAMDQSNTIPGAEAIYTIKFSVDAGLPPSTAIRIETPSSVDVIDSSHKCYVNLYRKRSRVCDFVGNAMIDITGAFTYLGRRNYSDTVEVVFAAENPSNTNIDDLSLSLEVYLDNTFRYKIAEIDEGLAPSFECEWPCRTCSPRDATNCESCFKGRTEREFLQEDRGTGKLTCVDQCLSGYTFDKSDPSKVCFPCDEPCATCRGRLWHTARFRIRKGLAQVRCPE